MGGIDNQVVAAKFERRQIRQYFRCDRKHPDRFVFCGKTETSFSDLAGFRPHDFGFREFVAGHCGVEPGNYDVDLQAATLVEGRFGNSHWRNAMVKSAHPADANQGVRTDRAKSAVSETGVSTDLGVRSHENNQRQILPR